MGQLFWQVAQTLKEPALQGRWFCYCPESAIPGNSGGNAVAPNTVLIERMGTPTYKTQPVNRPTNGASNNYAGPASIDGFSASFYENEDYDVTDWLQKWLYEVFNPDTGEYGLPSAPTGGYLRTMTIDFYNGYDQDSYAMRFNYTGVAPHEQTPFDLNYAERDGRLIVTANFTIRGIERQKG